MNTTILLNGVTYTPGSIEHSPVRVSTINEYQSGKKQEYFRTVKKRFSLMFFTTEAERLALETLYNTASTIAFTDEHSRAVTTIPTNFTASLIDAASPTNPKFAVTLDLEEV